MTRYACVSMMTPRMPSRTNQPRQRFRRNPSTEHDDRPVAQHRAQPSVCRPIDPFEEAHRNVAAPPRLPRILRPGARRRHEISETVDDPLVERFDAVQRRAVAVTSRETLEHVQCRSPRRCPRRRTAERTTPVRPPLSNPFCDPGTGAAGRSSTLSPALSAQSNARSRYSTHPGHARARHRR